MKLAGRVAVVTGASSGIGAATARTLAQQGATVVLMARRLDRLETLAAEISQAGGQAHVVPLDLRNTEQLTASMDRVAERWGRLDVLVNNAGVGYWKRTLDADPAQWQNEVEVNLIGPMFATHAAVPHMIAVDGGHIVNVSSLASRGPGPACAGYAASKAGLNIFSDSVLADLEGQGLRVTLIETGEVATEMQSDEDIAAIPMLSADDVAQAILFAVTRPDHVCTSNIRLFAATTD